MNLNTINNEIEKIKNEILIELIEKYEGSNEQRDHFTIQMDELLELVEAKTRMLKNKGQ